MSIVVFDLHTRFLLRTGQPHPNKNNKRDKMITYDDGRFELIRRSQGTSRKIGERLQAAPNKG